MGREPSTGWRVRFQVARRCCRHVNGHCRSAQTLDQRASYTSTSPDLGTCPVVVNRQSAASCLLGIVIPAVIWAPICFPAVVDLKSIHRDEIRWLRSLSQLGGPENAAAPAGRHPPSMHSSQHNGLHTQHVEYNLSNR